MPDDVQEQGISVVREVVEKDELYTDSSKSDESSSIKDVAQDVGKTTSEDYSEVPAGRQTVEQEEVYSEVDSKVDSKVKKSDSYSSDADMVAPKKEPAVGKAKPTIKVPEDSYSDVDESI